MEEKNEKIASLESSLKESSELIKTASLKTNKKNDALENPLKFKCRMCDFQSGSSGGLKTHIARKHTNYSENNLPIKCEICEENFEKEIDLKNHMMTHSYSKPEFLKSKCKECDFWGPNEFTMKMHLKRLHSEKISCGICDLEVADIETLDVHTFTCERFKCNWCKKTFNSVRDIKDHANKEHKGGRIALYRYNQMRNNEEFFNEHLIDIKDLVY